MSKIPHKVDVKETHPRNERRMPAESNSVATLRMLRGIQPKKKMAVTAMMITLVRRRRSLALSCFEGGRRWRR